ncbi:MAG TPA: thioredoxin domain-containing protein, partial [Planctomycetaceae bacterium]|nr:thioredoxin domain-containing protein [Planctomycetaceae bacterium]
MSAKSSAESPAPQKRHEPNRLARESSPYLLLHQHNPVDWYPWGQAAFEKAKTENKPIFLSIGYSSCYWCHVMERLVFENEEIAKYMNEHFVNVKVDREERPDVDDIYMTSLIVYFQLIGSPQGGGWPLSMFLTPEGQPFAGGSYFPPEDQGGRIGFPTVMERVHTLWTEKETDIRQNAKVVTDAVQRQMKPRLTLEETRLDLTLVELTVNSLKESYDSEYGGIDFRASQPNSPKFPVPAKLRLLLDRAIEANDEDARKIVLHTLTAIARGGIRDHLGGGFHRYSTDRQWLVPHFEKMLYDQGQLVSLYLDAWKLTQDPLFEDAARSTLDFVLAEMTDEAGGFYSALDAETETIEGKYYVWDPAELETSLGEEDYPLFAESFGLTQPNPFEHGYVLHLPRSVGESAKKLGIAEADLQSKIAPWKKQLLT